MRASRSSRRDPEPAQSASRIATAAIAKTTRAGRYPTIQIPRERWSFAANVAPPPGPGAFYNGASRTRHLVSPFSRAVVNGTPGRRMVVAGHDEEAPGLA